ncbi:polysaccharide biosynthesis protein [Methylocucumis oryzae]|uniref:polysaccharide biosynthesis protein n=1 Tax=Methylocucumis oryzae TaxID=1632867 RepID=UPI000AEDF5DD|nr:polysaccharide biosynthesis protein [Methylocucumis oryzae]
MIHLSGLAVKDDEHPNGEIEIVFTGLRSGEKLFEELLLGDAVSATVHPRILRAEEQIIPLVELEQILTILRQAAEQDDCERVQHVLQQTVMGLDLSAPIKDSAVNFN